MVFTPLSLLNTLGSAHHSWVAFLSNFTLQSCFHDLTICIYIYIFIWVAWRDVEEVWGDTALGILSHVISVLGSYCCNDAA